MTYIGCCIWLMTACLLLAKFPMATGYFLISTSRTAATEVVISNNASVDVFVTIKGLKENFSGLMAGNSENVTIAPYSSKTIPLPTDMNMNETGVYENNAISVKSADDISLLMYSITQNLGNLIIPFSKGYFRTSFFPVTPSCSHYSVLHMVANDISEIRITFPSRQTKTLFTTYKAIGYYGGDTLLLDMQAYSTAMVESLEDLTGTFVESNVPIGMFSGCDYSSSQNGSDFRSDWVPGQEDTGLQYVIMSHNEQSFSLEKFVIVSTLEYTSVATYTNDSCDEVKLNKSGDAYFGSMSGVNEVVVSDKPIVVVHMLYNQAHKYNMYYVTPVSMFRKHYTVTSFKNMALKVKITFQNEIENSFEVNGKSVNLDVRNRDVADIAGVGRLEGTDVFSNDNVYLLTTLSPYYFGGYMWSVDHDGRLFITSLGKKSTRQHTVCIGDEDPLQDRCVEPYMGCQGPYQSTTVPSVGGPNIPNSTAGGPNIPHLTNMPAPNPTHVTVPNPTNETVPSPTNVTVPNPTNVTVPNPTNVTVPNLTNVTVPNLTNVTVPNPTNVTVPHPTNVTVPNPTNVTVPNPTNVTVPNPTNVTVPNPTNVTVPNPTNVTVPNPTNVTVPNPTNVTVPHHTNVTVPNPTNVTVPNPTNVTVPNPTNVTVPNPTNVTVPNPTNVTVPNPTNVTVPHPTNVTVPHPTNMITPHSTNVTVPNPTNVTVPSPTNVTVPNLTNMITPHSTNVTVPNPTNVTVPNPTQSICPINAQRYNYHGQVICYWLLVATVSRAQAYDLCLHEGGQLPIIPNSGANQAVVDLISTRPIAHSFFLDYTVNYTSGNVMKSSGSPQNWDNGINLMQHNGPCVVINGTGAWTSSDCGIFPGNSIVCSACEGGGTSCYTHSGYCGPCSCSSYVINTVNITEELQRDLDRLRRTTGVNKKALSRTLRRITCASDPRPSSATMGYLGASLLATVFGGFILLDLPLLFLEFKTRILGLLQR